MSYQLIDNSAAVMRLDDGATIPADEANSDYVRYGHASSVRDPPHRWPATSKRVLRPVIRPKRHRQAEHPGMLADDANRNFCEKRLYTRLREKEAHAMATMTVSLPDPMKDWIEAQIRQGDYASVSDYIRDLVRRDRERRDQELTMDELRRKLAESRASGTSTRTVDEIFAEAREIARARGLTNG